MPSFMMFIYKVLTLERGWGWRMFVIKSISVTGLYTTAAVTFMYVLKHHRDLKPMAINNMIVYCLVIHHSF